MTNAEAIKVLERIRQWTDYSKEALTMAIEALSKPSLPSNLDEAAEEYEHNLGYYECMNQWPSVAFKAGAEWMAGQGEDGLVLFAYASGKAYIKTTYHGNGGDQVIVLVRKK